MLTDELIKGLVRRMNSRDDITGSMNLNNPGNFNIIELAEKVHDLTGLISELTNKPLPVEDPKQCQSDILLA